MKKVHFDSSAGSLLSVSGIFKGILIGIIMLAVLRLFGGLTVQDDRAWGQIPIEPRDSQTVYSAKTVLFRVDSEDSTIFRINGTDVDSTGIYRAWKNSGMNFTVDGDSDSVNVTVLFYGGNCYPLASDETKADYDYLYFGAPFDSVTYTEPGIYSYQFSDLMPIDDYVFAAFRGNTGNGADTTVEDGVVTKDRY